MTKKELEKEAEEYFKSICGDYNEEYERIGKRHYWVGFDIKNAYIASAEPREKRIEELEKDKAYTEGQLDEQIKATLKLQKENAGLKTDYKVLSCSVGDFGELQDKLEEEQRKNNGLSDNLTKAKELLKKYVIWCGTATPIKSPLQIEVEQFLNSEVEK